MEIRYPEYYRSFVCLAGNCPDTCCISWEITVDRESEKRYREAAKQYGSFGKKLKKYVRHGKIEGNGKGCPFLDRAGLCGIQRRMGEEALCRTCRRYPRHAEDYGDLHEVVLLLSCPEVCRLVLEENSGRYSLRRRPERHGNLEGIDKKLLLILLKARDLVWRLGVNSRLPWDTRMLMALALGHDLQREILRGNPAGAEKILWKFEADGADGRFLKQTWDRKEPKEGDGKPQGLNRFLLMSDFMEELAGLAPVGEAWPDMLEKSRAALYHSNGSRSRYQGERNAFFAENPDICRHWEKLFGYFIYSFMLASLYDKDVYSKIKMAVFCTLALGELDLAAWQEKRNALTEGPASFGSSKITVEEQVEICHVFARQIENSDGNRLQLEKLLKRDGFGIRRCAEALGE